MRSPPILAIALVLITSCSNLISMRGGTDTRRGEESKLELRVARENLHPGEITLREVADQKTFTTSYLVAKSLEPSGVSKNDFIPGDFMRQRRGARKLTVLLSGMGETVSTIRIANRLAGAGYDVLRLYPKIQLFDIKKLDTKEHWTREEFRAFVREGEKTLATRYEDVRHIVSQFKERYGYQQIGVMGISLGGITAYYLAGSYPDLFQSVAGVITGGSLCEILLVSEEPRIVEIRNKIFTKFDIKLDEAREILCKELSAIDPLSVASRINPKKALLVSNALDTVIPHRYTKRLWLAAHKPQWKITAIKLPVFWGVNCSFWLDGHYSSGIALIIPAPFFEFWGPIPYPIFQSAGSIILNHFDKTLK